MKPLLLAAAAAMLAGCASAAPAAAPASSAPSLPAGCSAALALLPSSPPANEQQAAVDTDRLGGQKGGTLASMIDQVAADADSIGFDLALRNSVTADVEKFQADARAVRSYCS